MTNKPAEHNDNSINSTNEENPLLPHITDELAENLRLQDVENLRQALDVLFGAKQMTPEREATLKKYNLMGLMLSEDEKKTTSEEKTKWLCQYWQDLAHLSLGIYSTVTPATVNIDLPQKSGSYKFIFIAPGILLGKQFTLMAGEEGFHREIFARYRDNNKTEDNKQFLEMSKGNETVNILGGGRIKLDAEKKHIKFYGSSGDFAFVADKIIEWATTSLRDSGWSTEICMAYAGKMQ